MWVADMALTDEERAQQVAARLAACKRYMRVDYTEDDELICGLLDMADEYLRGAGCAREQSYAMYDTVCHAMVLSLYDNRADDARQAVETVPQVVRQMLNQLKLRCNYGGGADDGAGG